MSDEVRSSLPIPILSKKDYSPVPEKKILAKRNWRE